MLRQFHASVQIEYYIYANFQRKENIEAAKKRTHLKTIYLFPIVIVKSIMEAVKKIILSAIYTFFRVKKNIEEVKRKYFQKQ